MDTNKAIKTYNSIMNSICHEFATIGTRLSQGTEKWNLRDMVSEMQYTLDIWTDPSCEPYQDAHDSNQPFDKPWLLDWVVKTTNMKRFIETYKEEALTMSCTEGHCSKFD